MNPDTATGALPKRTRSRLTPLRASLWLAVILVAAKAILLGVPDSPLWVPGLAMASFQDVLFAVCAGAAGEVAMRLAARRSTLVRIIQGSFVASCVLAVLYGVVAVGVFKYFGRPITYDLLRLAGGGMAVWSSIAEQITMPVTVALIAVPGGFLSVVLWDSGRRRPPALALAVAGIWIAAGWWQYSRDAEDFEGRRLALSPHIELFRSTVQGVAGAGRPTFPRDFPREDTAEFRSFGARNGITGFGFQPPAGVARPRNTIVVVLESIGTKYMSLYGSPYDTTPNLVAEAPHAWVFDDFHAHASYTYSSFRAINFSIYPGLPWCFAPWGGRPLPPTLASVMQARGCRTIYLHNGDLDWQSSRWMLEGRGFATMQDYNDLDCAPLTSWGTEDRCLFDRLIDWIGEARGQPFFAVCWTDQTHDPFAPSPGSVPANFFNGRSPPTHAAELSRYLNVLRETDGHLGRMFAALRDRGLADDTLVVITGDHGEAFRDPHDQRGHGLTVYQEEVHVPLVLWNPRLFSGGKRISTVGGHVDVNPTIADVLGVEPPHEWQGHSLFDPGRPPRAYFQTNVGEYAFGVREGSWKYIFDATSRHEMLFDLDRDPNEQRNAAKAEPDRCRRLRQRIAAWVTFEDDFLHRRTD